MKKSRLLAAVVFAIVATALPAKACSCALGDPRDALKASDGAFIGTLLSQTPDPDSPEWSSIYTFTVEETFKGELGETVEVHSASNGAACGLEVPIGGDTGLFLDLVEGEWHSSLCAQIAPEDLRAAAEPLPAPDGEGPIAMLASGSYGEAGIVALDSQGRTLAYGEREPDSGPIHVCPGSQRFLEVYGNFRRPELAVRDTSTLDVVREIDLPLGEWPYKNLSPVAMTCADEQADVIYLAALRYGGDNEDFVFEITGDTVRRIYRGKVGDFHFEGTDLYLTEGGRARFLVKLDLANPERDGIATVPNGSGSPRVSPNGKWVTLRAGGDRMKLVVVNTETGSVRWKRMAEGKAGEALWLTNRRIAFLAGGYDNDRIEIYTRRLQRVKVVPGQWYTRSNFLDGDVAYGMGWGVLFRAQLPDGPAEVLRMFESPSIYYLAPVRDEVYASE